MPGRCRSACCHRRHGASRACRAAGCFADLRAGPQAQVVEHRVHAAALAVVPPSRRVRRTGVVCRRTKGPSACGGLLRRTAARFWGRSRRAECPRSPQTGLAAGLSLFQLWLAPRHPAGRCLLSDNDGLRSLAGAHLAVFQRIEFGPPKAEIQVRFLAAGPISSPEWFTTVRTLSIQAGVLATSKRQSLHQAGLISAVVILDLLAADGVGPFKSLVPGVLPARRRRRS